MVVPITGAESYVRETGKSTKAVELANEASLAKHRRYPTTAQLEFQVPSPVDSPARREQSSAMKRTALLAILLASALAVGQKFQDVSAAGCPMSLSVKKDSTDSDVLVAARNNSNRGVLAVVVVASTTDTRGRVLPGLSTMDYVFKFDLIAPQEDRRVMPVIAAHHGASVKLAEGAVLFVQFEDGSTWGDAQVAKDMLAARPQKLAFLEHLVEVYDENGGAAFAALLNEPKHGSPEYMV